ncbi:MAG: hypothetical protein IBJ00_00265 [Alphaproteobacteria bacterium]|nr:hypothetical protein [Alphaproteobacteria bacterium]
MAKRSSPSATIQQKLAILQEQRLKLEAQRDQELLRVLHKTEAHTLNLFTLTGALLEAYKVVTANPSQAEAWHYAGERFLHPKRTAKNAKPKVGDVPAQKLATAQTL